MEKEEARKLKDSCHGENFIPHRVVRWGKIRQHKKSAEEEEEAWEE